ncbi:unnamed protein product [Choristocarpus tenellus]
MAEQRLREGPARNSGLNRFSVLTEDHEENGEHSAVATFEIQTYMNRQLVYAKKIVDEAMEGTPHDQVCSQALRGTATDAVVEPIIYNGTDLQHEDDIHPHWQHIMDSIIQSDKTKRGGRHVPLFQDYPEWCLLVDRVKSIKC